MPTAAARIPRSVSDQLRDAVRDCGLSVRELGKRADVDDGMIHRFLAGERSLTLTTVDRIAEALGVKLVEARPSRRRASGGVKRAG